MKIFIILIYFILNLQANDLNQTINQFKVEPKSNNNFFIKYKLFYEQYENKLHECSNISEIEESKTFIDIESLCSYKKQDLTKENFKILGNNFFDLNFKTNNINNNLLITPNNVDDIENYITKQYKNRLNVIWTKHFPLTTVLLPLIKQFKINNLKLYKFEHKQFEYNKDILDNTYYILILNFDDLEIELKNKNYDLTYIKDFEKQILLFLQKENIFYLAYLKELNGLYFDYKYNDIYLSSKIGINFEKTNNVKEEQLIYLLNKFVLLNKNIFDYPEKHPYKLLLNNFYSQMNTLKYKDDNSTFKKILNNVLFEQLMDKNKSIVNYNDSTIQINSLETIYNKFIENNKFIEIEIFINNELFKTKILERYYWTTLTIKNKTQKELKLKIQKNIQGKYNLILNDNLYQNIIQIDESTFKVKIKEI